MVARELTGQGALAAHLDAELDVDPDQLANPIQGSMAGAVPITTLLDSPQPPAGWRFPVMFVAVLLALGVAGGISARIRGSAPLRSVIRVALGVGYFARPETRLIEAAMMTAPSGKDNQAWRKMVRRTCLL